MLRKHVWFFPDLWHGDPPMAPVNPGYSKSTEDVKMALLGRHCPWTQSTLLTTAQLSMRIDDLWKGILSEDFVFSFRNSIEANAYNDMEAVYNKGRMGTSAGHHNMDTEPCRTEDNDS